jgi:vesicle coat complex subunit
VEALVQLISSSQDPSVLQEAAGALANIYYEDSAAIKQRAADAGAVEALVQLSSSSQDPGVLQSAVLALGNICRGDSADIR